ncbi:uncharacterized protein LOC135437192 [Drosophila montana]|uniref:uncharacterized protein LOC135437192 n=1 Tax=Drosophila montana TaxID=40370 RepID=UPI00313BB0B0
MSSISCVQPIPPTACGTQVRVAAATPSTNPQFSPHIKSAPAAGPPPPLPPRMKVNGIAEAAIRTPTAPTPSPSDLATAAVLSIDPIAATQFSISNATAPKRSPNPNPTSSPTQSKCRSVALKRNNSYRLANDELKLEMNKENCLSSTPPYGALPPMLHATSSLKLRNLSNMQLASTTPNSGCPAERKIAKSFERLVDEFSLSTTCIDSSYLKNKSLENFDDSPAFHTTSVPNEGEPPDNDTACDSSEEEEADELVAPHMQLPPIPHSRYHKSFVESVLLRPFKIILPNEDNGARRQRLLQKFEVTEIW